MVAHVMDGGKGRKKAYPFCKMYVCLLVSTESTKHVLRAPCMRGGFQLYCDSVERDAFWYRNRSNNLRKEARASGEKRGHVFIMRPFPVPVCTPDTRVVPTVAYVYTW